jgi:hypothetical protein
MKTLRAFGAHVLDEIRQVEAFWSLLNAILRAWREVKHLQHEYAHFKHQMIHYWHLFLEFLTRIGHRCQHLAREAIGI